MRQIIMSNQMNYCILELSHFHFTSEHTHHRFVKCCFLTCL